MPNTVTKNSNEKNLFIRRLSKAVWGAGLLFALVAGFTPIGWLAYSSVVLSTLGAGLWLQLLSKPPQTRIQSFLYMGGAAAVIALTAALLFGVNPSVGVIFGVTALMALSASVSNRFLKKSHSGLLKLPILAKSAYMLGGLAFVGLAVVFSFIAAGMLPTFILLPVFIAASVLTAIGMSLVTACTSAKEPAPYFTGPHSLPPAPPADWPSIPGAVLPATAPPALLTPTKQEDTYYNRLTTEASGFSSPPSIA